MEVVTPRYVPCFRGEHGVGVMDRTLRKVVWFVYPPTELNEHWTPQRLEQRVQMSMDVANSLNEGKELDYAWHGEKEEPWNARRTY